MRFLWGSPYFDPHNSKTFQPINEIFCAIIDYVDPAYECNALVYFLKKNLITWILGHVRVQVKRHVAETYIYMTVQTTHIDSHKYIRGGLHQRWLTQPSVNS
jgi:hypothetical protein